MPIQPFVRTSTPLWELLLLFVVGLVGALGQFTIIQAYRFAAASTIISFDYVGILYVVALDYLAFAAQPGWNLMAGGVLLIGSGVDITWEETRRVGKGKGLEVRSSGDRDLGR